MRPPLIAAPGLQYFKDTSQDFIDIKDMERRNITYNGYGRANREAHEFNLEYEMLTAFAKASVLRHCTSKGCEGKDYPWAEEDAEEDGGAPEALVEYEGQRVAGESPCRSCLDKLLLST